MRPQSGAVLARRRCACSKSARGRFLTRHDFGGAGVHYTLNPYRGCSIGCVYCSARPLHEYLGAGGAPFNATTDFDSKLVARPDAPALLEATLTRGHGRRLRGRVVQMSGATDPYQPLEASLGITRACLEVLLRHGNPVGLQTKSELVLRDRDPCWRCTAARACTSR